MMPRRVGWPRGQSEKSSRSLLRSSIISGKGWPAKSESMPLDLNSIASMADACSFWIWQKGSRREGVGGRSGGFFMPPGKIKVLLSLDVLSLSLEISAIKG